MCISATAIVTQFRWLLALVDHFKSSDRVSNAAVRAQVQHSGMVQFWDTAWNLITCNWSSQRAQLSNCEKGKSGYPNTFILTQTKSDMKDFWISPPFQQKKGSTGGSHMYSLQDGRLHGQTSLSKLLSFVRQAKETQSVVFNMIK